MRFSIHVTRRNMPKFTVAGARAALDGLYDCRTGNVYVPDRTELRERLPKRYQAAFDRSGSFWFDGEGFFNDRMHGRTPYMHLYGRRWNLLTTIYAIPVDDEGPK